MYGEMKCVFMSVCGVRACCLTAVDIKNFPFIFSSLEKKRPSNNLRQHNYPCTIKNNIVPVYSDISCYFKLNAFPIQPTPTNTHPPCETIAATR